jgi:hypothetical protein
VGETADTDQHFGLLAALLRVKDTHNVRLCFGL